MPLWPGPTATAPRQAPRTGLYIDNRWFDKHNITPRYEFGFGMTYTTFEYSNKQVNKQVKLASLPELPPAHATELGGNPKLWEVMIKVSVDVKLLVRFLILAGDNIRAFFILFGSPL